MQKILVLGGTSFIGRNLVAQLSQQKKYEIFLFNRAKTNPDLFPNLQTIIGDRNTADIEKIAGIDWDYVLDISCYFPHSIANVIQHLPKNLKRYIFISSVSAYKLQEAQLHRESSLSLKGCTAEQAEDTSDASYGQRKAACEKVLTLAPFDYVIFRPALVYGQYDPTDRFYYWLHQAKTKDKILIPNKGETYISLSYVKDLVDGIIQAMTIPSHRQAYNYVTCPKMSIIEIVQLAAKLMKRSPELVFAAPDTLKEAGFHQWVHIPLWIEGDWWTYSNEKLLEDFDLSFRSFEESLIESISYYEQLNWPTPSYGISDQQQKELIAKILA